MKGDSKFFAIAQYVPRRRLCTPGIGYGVVLWRLMDRVIDQLANNRELGFRHPENAEPVLREMGWWGFFDMVVLKALRDQGTWGFEVWFSLSKAGGGGLPDPERAAGIILIGRSSPSMKIT
jgi:hypothetical protein